MSKSKGELSWAERPQVVIVLGAVCCGVLLLNYYVKVPGVTQVASNIESWVVVISWFGLLLGMVTMLERNAKAVVQQKGEWYFRAVTIGVIVVMIGGNIIEGTSSEIFVFFTRYAKGIGQAAMFALHGFFVIAASIRTLKMRTPALIASIGAMSLLLFYNAPMFQVYLPWLMPVGKWLNDVGLTAGARALTMTGAVGAILLGYRLLLGSERQAYGFARGGTK